MVTFSLPGDDVAEINHSTPRSRAPLPFAKRAHSASSPYNTAPKRLGTPGSASRKTLWTRDDVPTSSLNRSFSGASNLFATSTISDSPPAARSFSPSLSQTPAHKVFAPGATPEPSRVHRERTAQPTPRGIVNKTMEKDLFTMRIEEPSKELSGDALLKRIPDGWDPRGSIYADQFLQDICPPEYDDEQRRQWFCVLDLRRLKHSANELFARKGWKLNIMNFAKEYEKSRSIILLHYGLYEFRNVKPDKELVKKWRREHGLPPLEDDEPSVTPSKLTSKKKRKASEDATNEVEAPNKSKRRATEKDDVQQTSATVPDALPAPPAAATPSFGKNKRKASNDDAESQPSKKPSSARTLFENAAKKASSTPSSAPSKTNSNTVAPKPTNSLMQSVLKNNAKTDAAQQSSAGSNIFGHLSDSSAKNSSQEADAESSTDSESEGSPEEVSDEPPTKKVAPDTTENSSNAGTRESTPGRSLFDRVSKGANGEPARAESPAVNATLKDQTWNPSTTPLKFATGGTAAPAPSTGLFGNAGSSSASTLFAPKSTTASSSNPFGAVKEDKPAENKSAAVGADKGDGESDKENDSTGPNQQKALPEPPKPQQNLFGASPFSPKPADASKETEQAKSAPANMFGGAKPNEPSNSFGTQEPAEAAPLFGAAKPAETSQKKPNLFGTANKPADDTSGAGSSVMSSSTLFGQKSAEPQKPLFGATASEEKKSDAPGSLFGAKPTETKPAEATSSIFGNGTASTPASKPLFGAGAGTGSAAQAGSSAPPIFSFGKSTESQANGSAQPGNLFGAPKSPPAVKGTTGMFDGSPMKQDDKSPAKPAFGANNGGASSLFGQSTPSLTPSFGANNSQPGGGTTTGNNLFGGMSNSQAAGGSGGFNFQPGGSSGGSTFNNPFSSGNPSSGQDTNTGFNFGGASGANNSAPSTFQFGANSGTSTPPVFGAGQANTNGTPSFGAGGGTSSTFSFGAGQTQPLQPSQGNNGPAFLAPPAASSTGTNTPSLFGGGSSLATTPARGTPEPSNQAEGAKGGEEEEGEKHEQIDLSGGAEEGEETLHEVRAKALRFVAPGKSEGDDEKPKSKSPWKTEGLGQLRLLKNKETNAVRLLLRAEPRGNVAMNRMVLPDLEYKAEKKYLKVTTSNDKGDGLETWMIQVKTEDLSKALAEALEENKGANKKE